MKNTILMEGATRRISVSGGDATYIRHVNIEKNDSGIQLPDFLDRFPATYSFATNLDRAGFEDGPQLSAGGQMIVGNEHRAHGPSFGGAKSAV